MKTEEARLRPGGTMASLTFGASFQRRARLNDVEAIFKIVETYARRGILLPRPRTEIASHIESFRVAELDGVVCGLASLRDFGDGVGELRSLSVLESAAGRGLGELLVRATVRDAAKAGITELYVLTASPGYFARFGWRELPWSDVPTVLDRDRETKRARRRWNTAMLLNPVPKTVAPRSDIREREARVHLGTYARQPITLVRGSGSWVWDDEGRRYLDLVAGIAVNVVGHAHPTVAEAVARQAQTLLQVSNLYFTVPQVELAEALTERSPFDRAFFTNSGTEANEAAIKLARRLGGPRGATEIVALESSFHGRTLGSLAATGQPKYQAPFAPLPGGFVHVPRNDVAALETAVSERTAAILVEPIQGESGIHPLTDAFLVAARAAADRVGALLILDEVQTGVGRTGSFFAFEQTPVVPDAVTLAKGLGGGVPIGALLVRDAFAAFTPGDHGTTQGGNPLSAAAALATLKVIDDERLLDAARERGAQFAAGLQRLVEAGFGTAVRGRGLMLGLDTAGPVARRVVEIARDRQRLLVNAIGESTLRIVPPLTISAGEVDEALTRLGRSLEAAAAEEAP
jgi:acetylornithine aminotransferase/acetylornithine/N-succinyldiaminopimelate aminotransferase